MLKRNIVNPKYRKLIWFVVIGGVLAGWIPTLMKMNANMNGVTFTHFDQELAISCVLDQSALGVDWACKKNQSVELSRFNPEPKIWVYETDDGEVKVTRSINLGVAKLEIEHPSLRKVYAATLE